MNNHTMTPNFKRVAAVVGALISFVAILAMFSGPAREAGPLGARAPTAEHLHGFHFTAENIFGLTVIGLISSTFGGMLGMGGGVLKMSFLLLFFGFHQGISRSAALVSYFVVAVGSSYRYLKLRFVMMDVVKILIPSSILGIIFGAIVGHHLSKDIMKMLLGMFLLFISVVMVKRMASHHRDVLLSVDAPAQAQDESSRGRPVGWIVALCGFPGGFLSAMLGISGGVATNPLQQVLARIPIKNAIANTLLKACVTVPIACVMILLMGIRGGHFDFWSPILVALCIIPGSIIGSQLGPALTRRMSSVAIHALLCTVALFMGINMLFFGN